MDDKRVYGNPLLARFVADIEAAGFEWEHYNGRYFWHGPAVRTRAPGEPTIEPTLQEVMRVTAVPLQWDNMGLGLIVYPIASEG